MTTRNAAMHPRFRPGGAVGAAGTVVVGAAVVVLLVEGCSSSKRATIGSILMLNETEHADELTVNGDMGCHVPLDSMNGAISLGDILQLYLSVIGRSNMGLCARVLVMFILKAMSLE